MKKILTTVMLVLISAGAMMAQNYKFAHVNYSELVQLMPEMDDARTQLDAASQETEATYRAMVEEFQTKYQDYQQKVDTWTKAVRDSKEQELTQIQNRIQEFEQSAQQDLSNMQNQLYAPIQQKAQEAVAKIAKDGGYIYVFDAASLLYFDDSQSVDLTPSARLALNIPADRTLEQLYQELQARAAAQEQ